MNTCVYNQVIGQNPEDVISPEVQQNYQDTCAIKSQQLVLENFGIHVSEDQLVNEAEQANIFTPNSGGTLPEDIGKLLEIHGVQCTQHYNASVLDLTAALAKGESVIIGVDSAELWDKPGNDSLNGEHADHALIVAGIDTSDPNHIQVILTDPGSGQEGARYPIEQFMDAWHDSGNFMVTTDTPTPLAYNPEMVNFDYHNGHLPAIGDMPYDYFEHVTCPVSHTPVDGNMADLFYSDVHQMMNGETNSFSPAFIHYYNEYLHSNPDIMADLDYDIASPINEPLTLSPSFHTDINSIADINHLPDAHQDHDNLNHNGLNHTDLNHHNHIDNI